LRRGSGLRSLGRLSTGPLEPVVGLGNAGRRCGAAPHIGVGLADQRTIGPVDVVGSCPRLQPQRSQRPLPVHPTTVGRGPTLNPR